MSKTVIVVGASRGFGRATAAALAAQAWRVVAVARTEADLVSLAEESDGEIVTVVGDARDEALAVQLLADHDPTAVVVGGGAVPHMAPLEQQTWETLSKHWEADVAIAFAWLKGVLTVAPRSLERVVVLSSGAALNGSPGSGGYAGAKATTRWLTTASAATSARSLGLDIDFLAVMPQLTHDTELGRLAVAGYAEMGGSSVDEALSAAAPYTAADAGRLIAGLASGADTVSTDTVVLGPGGLMPVPA